MREMREAKRQLFRLVEAAVEGEDVVIARNGQPLFRLVPVVGKGRLGGWGKLKIEGRGGCRIHPGDG